VEFWTFAIIFCFGFCAQILSSILETHEFIQRRFDYIFFSLPLYRSYKNSLNIVADCARRIQIPPPALQLVSFGFAQAWSSSLMKNYSVVRVSTELLSFLEIDELEGIIAHEIAHIARRDWIIPDILRAFIMGCMLVIYTALLGLIVAIIFNSSGTSRELLLFMSNASLALLIALPALFSVALLRPAIKRKHEFGADLLAARITGSPESLARALEKLYEEECLPGKKRRTLPWLIELFQTHPPLQARINRLQEMKVM